MVLTCHWDVQCLQQGSIGPCFLFWSSVFDFDLVWFKSSWTDFEHHEHSNHHQTNPLSISPSIISLSVSHLIFLSTSILFQLLSIHSLSMVSSTSYSWLCYRCQTRFNHCSSLNLPRSLKLHLLSSRNCSQRSSNTHQSQNQQERPILGPSSDLSPLNQADLFSTFLSTDCHPRWTRSRPTSQSRVYHQASHRPLPYPYPRTCSSPWASNILRVLPSTPAHSTLALTIMLHASDRIYWQ